MYVYPSVNRSFFFTYHRSSHLSPRLVEFPPQPLTKVAVVDEDVAVAVVVTADADVNSTGTVLPASRTFCVSKGNHISTTLIFSCSNLIATPTRRFTKAGAVMRASPN